MIVVLDPSNAVHRRAAAALHASLLPDSPVAQLGPLFMEKFYYYWLVRDGLVVCDLYRHENRFVALAAYTRKPFTFMEQGKKKHFFYLSLILARSLLTKPSRLAVILKILKLAARRGKNKREEAGELLSLAVQPAFSSHRDAATGKKVPSLMFERVMDFFRENRFKVVRFIVRKNNSASLLFFNPYGAVIREADYVDPELYLLEVTL